MQKTVRLGARPRGVHLVTRELYDLVPEVSGARPPPQRPAAPRGRPRPLLPRPPPRATSPLPQILDYEVGLCHVWILHTSASLSVNENADPTVRQDLNDALDRLVPDDGKGGVKYLHDDEGPDDMPAHIKACLMGSGLTLPITRGSLALGTWQGVYLNEHRNHGGGRSLVVTIQGAPAERPYGRSLSR